MTQHFFMAFTQEEEKQNSPWWNCQIGNVFNINVADIKSKHKQNFAEHHLGLRSKHLTLMSLFFKITVRQSAQLLPSSFSSTSTFKG